MSRLEQKLAHERLRLRASRREEEDTIQVYRLGLIPPKGGDGGWPCIFVLGSIMSNMKIIFNAEVMWRCDCMGGVVA